MDRPTASSGREPSRYGIDGIFALSEWDLPPNRNSHAGASSTTADVPHFEEDSVRQSGVCTVSIGVKGKAAELRLPDMLGSISPSW